jgi:glyoxylase-like metal-dependent hydrolase (beta-lactamase superfamily II)
MHLFKIETGNFMLDGGAMFGVVPKTLWQKVYPANENNLCNLAMRSLLISVDSRNILIDTGIGNKQDDKFFSHYYLNGPWSLESSLKENGLTKDDITDVILTHLHFDHCGGAVEYNPEGELQPAFHNANYWVSKPQWEWATRPNPREKASFMKENILPLEKSGQLNFIEEDTSFLPGIELRLFNGHSNGQMIPFINYNGKTIVFTADLIPTVAHLPAAYVCGYDTQPLVSMEERNTFLKEALEKDYILFFEHDINVECCSLTNTEKGIRMGKSFTFSEFLKEQY